MRRLLLLAISILGLFMIAPPGFIMADTGQGNEPVLMQDSPAPRAVLMHSPDGVLMGAPENGVLMHDPSGVLMSDPTSGKAVAITFCVRKPTTPERPLIVTTRHPALALTLLGRSAVRS